MQETSKTDCAFLNLSIIPKTLVLSPRAPIKSHRSQLTDDCGGCDFVIQFLNGASLLIRLDKYGTAGDACVAIRDSIGLIHDSLYSIFVKGDYSAASPIQDNEILKPFLQKNVVFIFRQELFIPLSNADNEVRMS